MLISFLSFFFLLTPIKVDSKPKIEVHSNRINSGPNTNNPSKLSQSKLTKKTKESSVSKTAPAKKKSSKRRKNKSKTLIVKTALKQFTLTYNKDAIAIKGPQLDLSLNRKKCNTHIMDRFNREIIQTIKEALKKKEMKTTSKKKGINTVEIQIEGKTYFVKLSSRIGQTFLHLPKEVLRMKWEEKFNCTKKKKQPKVSS